MAMKRLMIGGILLGGLFLAGWSRAARADLIAEHSGATNPTTEGFSYINVYGDPVTAGSDTSNPNYPAWSISTSARETQAAYESGALTATQLTELGTQGFVLTTIAQVVQGNTPAYTAADPVVIGIANLNTGSGRFDLGLGIDSSGSTVAVLGTSVGIGGPGNSVQEFGPSVTLSGGWHTYQLAYDPTTHTADLYVDGVDQIHQSNFFGVSNFISNEGLGFGAYSGGQAEYNLVNVETGGLSATPEPSTAFLVGAGALLWLGYAARRWSVWWELAGLLPGGRLLPR